MLFLVVPFVTSLTISLPGNYTVRVNGGTDIVPEKFSGSHICVLRDGDSVQFELFGEVIRVVLSGIGGESGVVEIQGQKFPFSLDVDPPFFSTTIDLGSFGLAHVLILSRTSLRVIYTHGSGVVSLMLERDPVFTDRTAFLREWRVVAGILGLIAIPTVLFIVYCFVRSPDVKPKTD